MERKLASIRKILNIEPIDGAYLIELVTIDGWKVVVAKNVGHKVGDLVVYCEVDSFLPQEPEFEFLRKTSFKKMGEFEGFRLKTIKLRGVLSQGLIIPIVDAINISKRKNKYEPSWTEGMDVTESLGIVKYDPPIPANLSGKIRGYFPSFLKKTDEERVQNLSKFYQNWVEMNLKGEISFYAAEKLDGSSATFYINNGVFGVCSRNLELEETDDNTFWKVARKLDIENKLRNTGLNIAIQGELIGEGVQGNPYKVNGQTVKLFNAFLIDDCRKMTLDEFIELTDKINIETVPIITDFKLPNTIDQLLIDVEGKSVLNNNTEREGYVIRSLDMSISFKCISNKFLLNEK